MTTLGTLAACSVLQITARLGSRTSEERISILKTAAPAPSQVATAEPLQPQAVMAQQSPAAPPMLVLRKDWGANEPSVSPDGYGEHGPYNAVTNPDGWLVYDQLLETILDRLIIHHSALPLTDGPREIQRLHMEEKGFADIGYHFLVNEKGQLFEGRSLKVRGAHTFGANYSSVGVCLIGNFEEIQPSPAQLDTLKSLVTGLVATYPRIDHMAGHKDFNPGVTLCPGANLYALLPDLAKGLNLAYRI
jgi:hypothetical protein